MDSYFGYRTSDNGRYVGVQEGEILSPLPMRLDVWSHSPTGFEWGYEGSGPAQLALAILLHATLDQEVTILLYQKFKRVVIAKLPKYSWCIRKEAVLQWTLGQLVDMLVEAQLVDLDLVEEDA